MFYFKVGIISLISNVSSYTPGKKYNYVRGTECSELNAVDWWTPGHVVQHCDKGTEIGSVCSIRCDVPYVYINAQKPNESWTVKCKKPSDPTWFRVLNRFACFELAKLNT